MAEPADQNRQPNWAFALVHGIGTAEPLDMIQQVSDALKAPRPCLQLTSDAEVHEVREEGKVRHHVLRHGTIPSAEVRFGTAHWADITYYRKGFLALIGSFLMTAFGVRFFAEMAARGARKSSLVERVLAFMLRILLTAMAIILATIVFPVTFVTLMYSLSGLVAEYAIKKQLVLGGIHFTDLQRWFIILVAMGSSLLYAWIGAYRVWPMRRERTLGLPIFFSIAFFATLVGLLMPFHNYPTGIHVPMGAPGTTSDFFRDVLRHGLMQISQVNEYVHSRIRITDGISVYFAFLHVLQLAAGYLMLILTSGVTVLLGAYCLAAAIAGRSFHTMVFAVVSTFSIWLILLIVLWPENLATYSAMMLYRRPAAELPDTVPALFLQWDKPPYEFFSDPLKLVAGPGERGLLDYYPILWFEGFYFTFLLLTMLLIIGIIVSRYFWRRMRARCSLEGFRVVDGEDIPRSVNRPRLIVAYAYVVLVLALMVMATLFVISQAFGLERDLIRLLGIGLREDKVPHEVYFQTEWVRLLVIIFVMLFLFLSHTILDGTRLVLDVVNHFTQPAKGYPVRQRIEKRFDEIIEHLLAPGDKPHFVIIAHSQGTVITLDHLAKEGWIDNVLSRVASLTVITFGSPITHVYQNYFPRLYPPLAETRLAEIARDPRIRWVNAYRIDDFIGTYIENSIPSFPVNVPLPIGGHTNYWTGEVMRRVLAEPVLHDFVLPAMCQPSSYPLVSEP